MGRRWNSGGRFRRNTTPRLIRSANLRRFMLSISSGTRFQQMKISTRVADIARDLFTQRFHRRELDLIPQPLQEEDFHLGLRGELDGMKIEQVAFDGKRFGSEGGTIAHVGD